MGDGVGEWSRLTRNVLNPMWVHKTYMSTCVSVWLSDCKSAHDLLWALWPNSNGMRFYTFSGFSSFLIS